MSSRTRGFSPNPGPRVSARRGWPLVVVGLLLGCTKPQPAPQPPPETPSNPPSIVSTTSPAAVQLDALRRHVEFLAADDQGGRAPGTPGDEAVQQYVVEQMKGAGLQPAFGSHYRQKFTVTDGVVVKDPGGTMLDVSGIAIPHHVVPFTADTSQSGPAVTPFVFVEYGLVEDGVGTGSYRKLESKVRGKIVVALHGAPPGSSLGPEKTRAQTKVISARDHGAVGVVLWDPTSEVPLSNHGKADDFGIPVVFVGADGNAALVEAFSGRKPRAPVDPTKIGLRRGAVTKKAGTLMTNVAPRRIDTANVAGIIPGNGDGDGLVVIGAHMDHLGMGSASSLAPGEAAVHNGADDNASGVAVMLEVCRALAATDPQRRGYDVLCMAFGAEEMGLLGSKYFLETVEPTRRERISAMINFDMVGRLRDDAVMVAGVGTSEAWPDLVDRTRGTLVVNATEDGYGPSDHSSFYEAGVPVLHFFTGPHEDYHKPSDDIERIDFPGTKRVGDMALALTQAVLAERIVLGYVKTERTSPEGGQRQFRISLGTIPDYAAEVVGVRLSGVRAGGAAEKAGLRAGDVIIKIGDRDIHNFDEFMAMFGVLEPGEPVAFVVLRDEKTFIFVVTPGAPRPQ